MIVDLVRNDLGRVCDFGSVEVPALLSLEHHPGLVHLVSTVRGRLRPGRGWADAIAATFPPGSVTGAPKLAALEQIAALEPVPRGVYCGAVGWVDADRKQGDLNVAIRTFWVEDEPAPPRHRRRHHLGQRPRRRVGGDRAQGSPAPARRVRIGPCLSDRVELVWLDGRLVDATDATVSIFDHGLTVGDGVFETLKAIDGRPFATRRHLDRLRRSADGLELQDPLQTTTSSAAPWPRCWRPTTCPSPESGSR